MAKTKTTSATSGAAEPTKTSKAEAKAETVRLRALKNIPPVLLGRGEGGRREYQGATFEVDERTAGVLLRRKIAERTDDKAAGRATKGR